MNDKNGNKVNPDSKQPYMYICNNGGCPIRLTSCPIIPMSVVKSKCYLCGYDMVEMPICECGKIVDYLNGEYCIMCGKPLTKNIKSISKTKVTNLIDDCSNLSLFKKERK